MKKTIIMILSLSLLAACAKKAEKDEKEDQTAGVMIASVTTDKATCMDRTPKECLRIDDTLVFDDTQGFNFEYGYEYKLKIQRQYAKLDKRPQQKKQLYTYHLIKVLDQTKID